MLVVAHQFDFMNHEWYETHRLESCKLRGGGRTELGKTGSQRPERATRRTGYHAEGKYVACQCESVSF